MYGKWPHGKMKHTTLQKRIDEAIGDMEPAQPLIEQNPQDEELVAQIPEDTQDLALTILPVTSKIHSSSG